MRSILFILLSIAFSTTLVACQQVKDSDVVFNNGGETSNLDQLKEFIKSVENSEANTIRIVRYTTEGDPIFHTLDYDGKNITYTYDATQDEYAGSNNAVKSTTCTNLESSVSDNKMEYQLSGCASSFGNHFDFYLPK